MWIRLVALLALAAAPVFAGHGFFSPAPSQGGSILTDLVPGPNGAPWALAGGALYRAREDGRSFRFVHPWTDGFYLYPDPSDPATLVTEDIRDRKLSISRDAGETWQELPLPGALPRVTGFAATRNAWYAVAIDSLDPEPGSRPYRSVDQGRTWELMTSSDFVGTSIDALPGGELVVMWDFRGIFITSDGSPDVVEGPVFIDSPIHVEISPAAPNRILVFEGETLLRSVDRGRTFDRISLFDTIFSRLGRVETLTDPQNPNRIVAAGVTTGRDVLLTSDDGGATWALRNSAALEGRSFPTLLQDPCSSQVIYAAFRNSSGFLRSTDFGRTWIEPPPPTPGLGEFSFTGPIGRGEGCRIYASTSLGLLTSLDRGDTWESADRGFRGIESSAIAFDRANPLGAWAGGLGLHRSRDGGRTWTRLDNAFAGLSVRDVLTHPDGSLLVLVGNDRQDTDVLWRSVDGGETFTTSTVVAENDFSSVVAVDPRDPSRVVAVGRQVGVQQSLDFGRTWTLITEDDGLTDFPNRSLAIDPTAESTLWGAEFSGPVRSLDGGVTWEETGPDDSIYRVVVHPQTGHVWALGSLLWRSVDGGETFQSIPDLFGRFQDLAVDRNDPQTLYLSRDCTPDLPTLYRSTDGGDTWSDAEPAWAGGDIGRLAQNPGAPEEWIAAASQGLHWRSNAADPGCASASAGVGGLCLRQGRFAVRAAWSDFTGRSGQAEMVPFQTDESGVFTFFSPDNWELMVKVLDGCGFNGHRWVFAAGVTNVDFTIQVTDRSTGELRQYFNVLGEAAPAVTDTEAFRCADSGDALPSKPAASNALASGITMTAQSALTALSSLRQANELKMTGCGTEDDPALCLGPDGRFRVSARWRDFSDRRGAAEPVSFSTDDSGLFTFFSPGNWELMVKVLDGCGFNNRVWIFGAGTTNVEFDLTITDQETGVTRSYRNPLGEPSAAIIDTSAFDACPSG
ncbi:MAG: hypothetical protein AAGM22_01330 [Acidobacteriota bacterium]